MPYLHVNDVDLFYKEDGTGEAVVLVHGGWDDHTVWNGVVPPLAERFRVVRYDRRGYGQSGQSPGTRTRRQDEDDLAELMGVLGCTPAHVVGNSFGASIALALASRRPERLRSLSVHEPPLIDTVPDDAPRRPLLNEIRNKIGSVADQLRHGDLAGGAERFVEHVALGPGAWQQFPVEVQEFMVRHAPAFLGDIDDPGWAALDLDAAAGIGRPLLLTTGSESPPWLREIAAFLPTRIAGADLRTLQGCGHLPHETDPDHYGAVLQEFIASAAAPSQ